MRCGPRVARQNGVLIGDEAGIAHLAERGSDRTVAAGAQLFVRDGERFQVRSQLGAQLLAA